MIRSTLGDVVAVALLLLGTIGLAVGAFCTATLVMLDMLLGTNVVEFWLSLQNRIADRVFAAADTAARWGGR